MKRIPKPRHDLSGLRPTADILYILDKGICWLCKKHVEPEQASLDHAIPKYYMGKSLRHYRSFSNSYLAHRKCNRVRGCPIPSQDVIRWDRLVEEDYEFIRRLFRVMEQHWGGPRSKAVIKFLSERSEHVPFTTWRF